MQSDNPAVVPINIAVEGKPEIAAYLYAVHYEHHLENSYKPWLIAHRLDVKWETVTKYCRRVIRDAKSQKVGGVEYLTLDF